MTKRSPESLLKLFRTHDVLEFKQIQAALDKASRATTFRYLKQIPYHRSYNYNGRYYTRKDLTPYDRFGLFSHNDIRFSREPSLGETIRKLVWKSEAGWTQRELQDVLKVRIQVILLSAFRQNKVTRKKGGGFYVYLHTDPTIQVAQLTRRREKIELAEIAQKEIELRFSDQEAIHILITLLHHPGAKAADVVRYLRGHSPPITLSVVSAVFSRFDLDNIGKKGGTSNY